MTRRRGLVIAAVGAVLLAMVAIGRDTDEPLDPDGTGPDGARALVLLLDTFAAEVTVADSIPESEIDTAVLLDDRLSARARAELRDWVRSGGTLVVADPASPFVPEPAAVEIGQLTQLEIDRGACDIEALSAVERLEIGGRVGYPVTAGDGSCFGDGRTAFVLTSSEGDGTLVAVGGAGVWINSTLDQADNAVLAVALLAPRPDTDVAVLRSNLTVPARPSDPQGAPDDRDSEERSDVGAGDTGLIDLMPDYMRWVAIQLALAWIVYAVARGRRLGRPVSEPQPVRIPGREIVRATGRLLGSVPAAETAEILCEALTRDLVDQLGLPRHTSIPVLADVVAVRTGLDRDEIERALSPVVGDDASLVALVGQHDRIREEVSRVGSP